MQHSIELNRTLELRQTPHLGKINRPWPNPYDDDAYLNAFWMINASSNFFGNLTTNWLYTAIIEGSLNGSEPLWSRDGWSFIPVDISSIQHVGQVQNIREADTGILTEFNPLLSVTIQTLGIRGRAECTPSEAMRDETYWLRALDNQSEISRQNTMSGYTLRDEMTTSQDSTSIIPKKAILQSELCCFNQTGLDSFNGSPMPVVIGYWTTNLAINDSIGYNTTTGRTGNFTATWIRGTPDPKKSFDEHFAWNLVFDEVPSHQFLNCMPVIETSAADVTVDRESGRVLSFNIRGLPEVAEAAWSDSFLIREVPGPERAKLNKIEMSLDQNITSRYNTLLFYSLLLKIMSELVTESYSWTSFSAPQQSVAHSTFKTTKPASTSTLCPTCLMRKPVGTLLRSLTPTYFSNILKKLSRFSSRISSAAQFHCKPVAGHTKILASTWMLDLQSPITICKWCRVADLRRILRSSHRKIQVELLLQRYLLILRC